MKRLILLGILIISLTFVGCGRKNNVSSDKDNVPKTENNIKQDTPEINQDNGSSSGSGEKPDNSEVNSNNNSNSNENDSSNKDSDKTDNNKKSNDSNMTKIDISSMERLIEPVIYSMIADGQQRSYSEAFSSSGISWTAYCMIYWQDSYVGGMLDDEGKVVMDRSELNKQIKAVYNNFDGSIIPNIYYEESDYAQFTYSPEDDTYSIMPGDPSCWVKLDIKDAVMGANGRGSAQMKVTLCREKDEDRGMYELSLVKDSNSKYKYSITNIKAK